MSGKMILVHLRIQAALRDALKVKARERKISLSALIVEGLKSIVESPEKSQADDEFTPLNVKFSHLFFAEWEDYLERAAEANIEPINGKELLDYTRRFVNFIGICPSFLQMHIPDGLSMGFSEALVCAGVHIDEKGAKSISVRLPDPETLNTYEEDNYVKDRDLILKHFNLS